MHVLVHDVCEDFECQLEHMYLTCTVWRQVLQQLILKRRDEIRVRRPGLACFKDGVRQIPIESIPGVCDSGWQPDQAT